MKELLDRKEYKRVNEEIVLDFEIKNKWEQLRNKNLTNFNSIIVLVRCIRCGEIYPYLFEIEKESYDQLFCKYCNNQVLLCL